jgi:hypothetical protein
LVNGIAVVKHAEEESGSVHDPSKLRINMAEIHVWGMQLILNFATQIFAQV